MASWPLSPTPAHTQGTTPPDAQTSAAGSRPRVHQSSSCITALQRLLPPQSAAAAASPACHADGPAWRAGAGGLGSLVRHPEGCSRHLSRLSRSFRRPLGPPAPNAGSGLLQVPPAPLPQSGIQGVVVMSTTRWRACTRACHTCHTCLLARPPGGTQAERGAATASACLESGRRGPGRLWGCAACVPSCSSPLLDPPPRSTSLHVHVCHALAHTAMPTTAKPSRRTLACRQAPGPSPRLQVAVVRQVPGLRVRSNGRS